MTVALEIKGITKKFAGVIANNNISFSVEQGKILCIVGENGAGKSTLMNIIYGLYRPDSGKVFVNGEECRFKSPHDAIKKKIGMVHQHFMLIPNLTIAENIILGIESLISKVFFSKKKAIEKVKQISEKYGFNIDSSKKIEECSVGTQQKVEILKTLIRDAEILILDEPTAVLTPSEVTELFQIIKKLASDGKTILFITHKMSEVFEVSDMIAVLRRGNLVAFRSKNEIQEKELSRLIVGGEIFTTAKTTQNKTEEVILSVKNIEVKDNRGLIAVNNLSFDLYKGEIFGVGGVDGNGQRELSEVLIGLRKINRGQIFLHTRDIKDLSVKERRQAGISYIPEDRRRTGLVLDFSVADNLVLGMQDYDIFKNRFGLMRYDRISKFAQDKIREFDVRPGDKEVFVKNLSGGNQQKVILAREFAQNPEVMIAVQPTRGLDINATYEVHKRLLDAVKENKAVILISLDLDELIALTDRIGVMYKGSFIDIVETKKTTKEKLGHLMLGFKE